MSHSDASGTPVQPNLAELMARYLEQRTEAQAAGLVSPDASGEVVPFEAAPVQTVDPRLAWSEALAAIGLMVPKAETGSVKAPPDWPMLVAVQEPAVALAFAVGNFPQLVRHVQPILQAAKLTSFQPSAGRPIAVPALVSWAAEQNACPELLLALGSLRLGRHFEAAAELLARNRKNVPADWQPALANEEAALAWHRGLADEAAARWRKQRESVPVLFNRGMAALFLGKSTDARSLLSQAIQRLAEDSAWHHLGQLYLALAQMKR